MPSHQLLALIDLVFARWTVRCFVRAIRCLLFCGIRGRDSAGIGRLASITARTAPIASAYSHEAHNDGAAGESRSINLVKQKSNLTPKTIKSLYAFNTALLCLLIANLLHGKIRPASINIQALINRYSVVFGPKGIKSMTFDKFLNMQNPTPLVWWSGFSSAQSSASMRDGSPLRLPAIWPQKRPEWTPLPASVQTPLDEWLPPPARISQRFRATPIARSVTNS